MRNTFKSRRKLTTTAFIISAAFTRALLADQDHLVPILPFDAEQQVIVDILVAGSGTRTGLWMIGESGANTFADDIPEYAVMIHLKFTESKNTNDSPKPPTYTLEVARLDH